jgi:hypothetical protein
MDKERDLSKNRVITFDNGTKATIRCKDPYGFWTIHFDHGSVPDKLSGQYTTYVKAEDALKSYLLEDNHVYARKIEKVEKGFGIVTDGKNTLVKK